MPLSSGAVLQKKRGMRCIVGCVITMAAFRRGYPGRLCLPPGPPDTVPVAFREVCLDTCMHRVSPVHRDVGAISVVNVPFTDPSRSCAGPDHLCPCGPVCRRVPPDSGDHVLDNINYILFSHCLALRRSIVCGIKALRHCKTLYPLARNSVCTWTPLPTHSLSCSAH